MLAVVTGPVRSGKSSVGLRLAQASGRAVVVAVGGRADDPEMARRIAAHQAERGGDIRVIEVDPAGAWLADVPADACLLVDCLGTVLGSALVGSVPDDAEIADAAAERAADQSAAWLIDALAGRDAPTVVVTNEVGWGIVPATPLGRLFRDALGRANKALVARADAAWLVVHGRCIDLKRFDEEVAWPTW